MAIMNLDQMARSVLSKKIAQGSLQDQKKAALSVLKLEYMKTGEPHIMSILNRVHKCRRYYRCNSPWCPTCSNPSASKAKRINTCDTQLPKAGTAITTTTSAKSTEYRVRGGQRMMKPFNSLPLVLCHPVTINLMLVPIDGNLEHLSRPFRRRLQRLLQKLSKGSICRGKFDIALKYADELEFGLPPEAWPPGIDPNNPPHERVALLHFHGVVFDPHLSHRELRKIIADEFIGKKRVCVRRAHETVTVPDGSVCSGLQGYLEYSSMEKIEINFGDESTDAVLEFAKINSTWKRSNRNYAYGKSIALSGITIDEKHVSMLERRQRLDWVKRNWNKLSYYQKFIYQWLSHASQIAALARQRSSNRSNFTKAFNQIYTYHCNWCRSKLFETLEFLDFLKERNSHSSEKFWPPAPT